MANRAFGTRERQMEDRGFDALARNVADAATRRGWLRMVAGLLAAAVLASDAAAPMRAGGRRRRRRGRHDPGAGKDQRKGKRKGRRDPGAARAAIAAGWPCSTAERCDAGLACVKPNPDHWSGYCKPVAAGDCAVATEACEPGSRPCCGELECRVVPGGQAVCMPPAKPTGTRCSRGTDCQGGRCRKDRCRCAEDLVSCGGECVDFATDPRHCGGCGNACGGDEFCFQGVCSVGGGAGWGWGGGACSFPTDEGYCWGWPVWSVAYEPARLVDVTRRGVSCERTTSEYRCPLCAFGGNRSLCGAMDAPTREQVLRHCKAEGTEITIASCQQSNCLPGETLCTHWCRTYDTLCPPRERGSFVPSVEVCTTQPERYCGEPLPPG